MIVFVLIIAFALLSLIFQQAYPYTIELGRYWEPDKIDDYELTYVVNSEDRKFHTLVDRAIEEWQTGMSLAGASFSFAKSRNLDTTNIEFKEADQIFLMATKNNQREIQAETLIYGYPKMDDNMMTAVDVMTWKDIPTTKLKYNTIKHEIGHALGLMHADSPMSLMYDDQSTREDDFIGMCEAYLPYNINGLVTIFDDEQNNYFYKECSPDYEKGD